MNVNAIADELAHEPEQELLIKRTPRNSNNLGSRDCFPSKSLMSTQIRFTIRDEEPHLVVSVEKQFKKSGPLDTDQEFTITAGAPGTYTYFCSIHPKMTGKIIVEKS
jgi:Cupredoxin-like domain